MIFVTVGTDLPFDRMVRIVDQWAALKKRKDVYAQIGDGGWKPKYINYVNFMAPSEFAKCIKESNLIISHAGMGTIITALLNGKRILVLPKRASLGEHRSEHQVATALRMKDLGNINVALNEAELISWLDRLDDLKDPSKIGEAACDKLVLALREFIFSEPADLNRRENHVYNITKKYLR